MIAVETCMRYMSICNDSKGTGIASTLGFGHGFVMYHKSTSIRHFEQPNQQLSNLI